MRTGMSMSGRLEPTAICWKGLSSFIKASSSVNQILCQGDWFCRSSQLVCQHYEPDFFCWLCVYFNCPVWVEFPKNAHALVEFPSFGLSLFALKLSSHTDLGYGSGLALHLTCQKSLKMKFWSTVALSLWLGKLSIWTCQMSILSAMIGIITSRTVCYIKAKPRKLSLPLLASHSQWRTNRSFKEKE